jgi:Ca2+-binding EF-hand superfamily protein
MTRYRSLVLITLLLSLGVIARIDAEDSPSNESKTPGQATRRPDWARTGHSRYNWNWLAQRYDKDGDGVVTRDEFPLSDEVFARIERTWDGVLTADDFDWSKDGVLGRQKETAFAMFKPIDKDSNGRITAEEWQEHFAKVTKDKGYLSEEDLERFVYLPRIEKASRETRLRTGNSEFSPRRERDRNQVPQPGDEAPDFELRSPDGKTAVKLSSFRGKKPVVLIFGCFTCGNYRTYSESLEATYDLWKKDAEFLRVYVREAHPVAEDTSATSTNGIAGILIKQPTTLDERCSVADRFTSALHVKTPLVVDEIDNRVGQMYSAWPDRLYIVDRDGRIAFSGGPGPFAFNPREMEQSLAMLLLDQPTPASDAR